MFFLKTTELICWQSRRTRILTQSLGRPAGSRKQPSSGCLRIWWLLAISDIPWLIDASLSFLLLLPQAFYLLCMSTIFSYILTRMPDIGLGTLTHLPGPPFAQLFLYIAYTATRSFWEIIRVLASWQVFLWHLIYKCVCYSSFLESVILLFVLFSIPYKEYRQL